MQATGLSFFPPLKSWIKCILPSSLERNQLRSFEHVVEQIQHYRTSIALFQELLPLLFKFSLHLCLLGGVGNGQNAGGGNRSLPNKKAVVAASSYIKRKCSHSELNHQPGSDKFPLCLILDNNLFYFPSFYEL